jgi:hypothetical protein
MYFTKQALERSGFVGWIPFPAIRGSACPSSGGVYVVTYSGGNPLTYAKRSCGGLSSKRKDPTVSREILLANWVDDAEVVYIGKAVDLMFRLTRFARFGTGKSAGHWGGRLIWQLPKIDRLLVAWKETPGRDPFNVETELKSQFRRVYGKPPFANDPHRMGR